MSFEIEKRVKGRVYVYSVQSTWDKDRKKSVKKYTYVGVKHEGTGHVKPKKGIAPPRSTDDFGPQYLIDNIVEKLKLDALVSQSFSDVGQELIATAAFQVIHAKPTYLMEYYQPDHTNQARFSSQRLSEMFRKIGSNKKAIRSFQNAWLDQNRVQTGVFYDITSFSSYAKQCELVEWGYNRDGDDLPQINFGILYGTSSALPLFYKVYPGSISDVSTFTNVCKELASIGMENFTLCLDRGFYSAKNLAQVHGERFDIMIPMPFSTAEASRLSLIDIATPENLRNVNGHAIFGKTFEIAIANNKFYATVFQTEKRRTNELDQFAANLHKCEQIAIGVRSDTSAAAEGVRKTFPSIIAKCFSVDKSDDVYSLKRDDNEIKDALARMGKMIILTKLRPPCLGSLLSSYRARDAVEKSFDLMKNELSEARLRVVGSDAVEGRLFVNFIALIIMSYLRNALAASKLSTKLTIAEALCELNKLKRATLYDGSTCLTEISKKQRDIFAAFGVSCPKL